MVTVVFEERVVGSAWIRYLLIAGGVLLLVVPWFESHWRWPKLETLAPSLLGVGLLLVVGIIFINLRVRMTSEDIWFGFWKFGKRLKLEEIAKAEIRRFRFRDFGGFGIRWARGGVWAYVNRSSEGVQLETKRGRRYYFSTAKATEWVSQLTARRAN